MKKPVNNNRRWNKDNLYGIYPWLWGRFCRVNKPTYTVEEDFVARLGGASKTRDYYDRRAKREERWYNSRCYQRWLLQTVRYLKQLDKAAKRLVGHCYHKIKHNDIEIPVEANAAISIICSLPSEHKSH